MNKQTKTRVEVKAFTQADSDWRIDVGGLCRLLVYVYTAVMKSAALAFCFLPSYTTYLLTYL